MIFDLGLGNVFVSRVAGNSMDVGTLGSTEYAVAVLGEHLVMVLGHSNCGAVKAAIKVANGEESFPPKHFGAIGEVVDALVEPIRSLPRRQRTVERSIEINARAQARRIAGRTLPDGWVVAFKGTWHGAQLPLKTPDNSFTEVFTRTGAVRRETSTADAGVARVTLRSGGMDEFNQECAALAR